MDEHASEPLLLKIKPWLESGGPFQPDDDRAGAPEEDRSFSTLDLRDRVVLMLLREHVVEAEQVETAWGQRASEQANTPGALWRVVAQLAGVDSEAVFAAAARVYAFEPATAMLHRAGPLLREHRGRFSPSQRRDLAALGVLPVGIYQTRDGRRWVFATHDPARSAVHSALRRLRVPAYELRYAPAAAVRAQLEVVFPEATEAAPFSKKDLSISSGEEKRTSASRSLSFLDALFASDEAGGTARKKLRGSETARAFASIYEELIAGAARSGATRLRLAAAQEPGPKRRRAATQEPARQKEAALLVSFDYDARDTHRQVEVRVPPEAVLSFMRRRIRSSRRSAAAQGRKVHRWVEGRRHSFRIAALPRRSAWADGRAEIVIEAVD